MTRRFLKTLQILGSATVASVVFASASVAASTSRFDGSWDIVFSTRTGACDPAYNFTVNISRGIITHPNLVRFKGTVMDGGFTRASVAAGDKFASGSGRLFAASGSGSWSGFAGNSRCSGRWDARRN